MPTSNERKMLSSNEALKELIQFSHPESLQIKYRVGHPSMGIYPLLAVKPGVMVKLISLTLDFSVWQ